MKVFLSWSGQRSKAVAELLSEWIKCVLQASRPWISTQNIDRGAIWFNEIQTQLQDTSVGIVCLTQENKLKPWILFEAGALAKGLTASRVCTFLVDLQPTDVENPLAQFNHTLPEEDSLWQLVLTLNSCLPAEQMLPEQVLSKVFDIYWPRFKQDFASALDATKEADVPVVPRSDSDVLAEILSHTRTLSNRVSDLERRSLQIEDSPVVASKTYADLVNGRKRYAEEDGKLAQAQRTLIDAAERLGSDRTIGMAVAASGQGIPKKKRLD